MNIEEAKEQLISLQQNAKANIDTDEIFKLDYEAIETVLNLIKKQKEEIEKKDKVIKDIQEDIEHNIYLAESNYDIEKLNDYAKGMYDAYIEMRKNLK